jgi:hypothetical protein
MPTGSDPPSFRAESGRSSGGSPLRPRHHRGHHLANKCAALNGRMEHLDHGQRHTSRTSQVRRSFEDTALKRRAREPAELQRRHRDGASEALARAKARPGGETLLVSLQANCRRPGKLAR